MLVTGAESWSCGIEIMNCVLDEAWNRFKVNTGWGWLEDDTDLSRVIMEMVTEQGRSARMKKVQEESLRKEEKLLKKAMLEHEWKERREKMAKEMMMEVDETSKKDGLEILEESMRRKLKHGRDDGA